MGDVMALYRSWFVLVCFCVAASADDLALPAPDRICADLTPSQAALVREGIALHDARKYDEAIAKYQVVLSFEPWATTALHELAYTYFESKRYADALEVALQGARCRSERPTMFPVIIGNALDELGRGREAVAIYEEAIRRTPKVPLLRYNLAVSLKRTGRRAEAKAAVEDALALNPNHASSHAVLAELYREMGYRIPAVLAYLRLLQLEPEGARASRARASLEAFLAQRAVPGKGPNQVVINVPDPAQTPQDEGNFTAAEMALGIHQAAGLMTAKDGPVVAKTAFARAAGLVEALLEGAGGSEGSGFAVRFYVPYFVELQKAGLAEALTARVWGNAEVEGLAEWVKGHTEQMRTLGDWSAGYRF